MKRRDFFKLPLAAGAVVATSGLPAIAHPAIIQQSIAERFVLNKLSDKLPADNSNIVYITDEGFADASVHYQIDDEVDPPRTIMALDIVSEGFYNVQGDILWMYSNDFYEITYEVTKDKWDINIEIDPTKIPILKSENL
jgi:hypothetical protein